MEPYKYHVIAKIVLQIPCYCKDRANQGFVNQGLAVLYGSLIRKFPPQGFS